MSKASLKTRLQSSKIRKIAGVFAGLALCATALGAIGPALMDPGPSKAVSRALNIAAVEEGRAAYLKAMMDQGYEILPPVKIAHAKTPIVR